MSYRLTSTRVSESRKNTQKKEIKSKILFFVEGAKTEIIYLQTLKNYVSPEKNITVEVFDRWKDLSGESNQLKIVKTTKEYLETCSKLGRKKRNKIDQMIEKLEYNEWTIDEMYTMLTELRTTLGTELLSSKDFFATQLQSIKTCYDYDKEYDRICFVLDRDYQSFIDTQYDEVISICETEGFELGISSPNFEFYLLLHLDSFKDEDKNDIFVNKEKFTEKSIKLIMSEKYKESYKKEKYNAGFFLDRFSDFQKNIMLYNTNPLELKTEIGSSLGEIVSDIIN